MGQGSQCGLVRDRYKAAPPQHVVFQSRRGSLPSRQAVEHYEIAAYGTLVEWAKLLGKDDAVELLQTTLAEEKETDEKLTAIASELNLMAQTH